MEIVKDEKFTLLILATFSEGNEREIRKKKNEVTVTKRTGENFTSKRISSHGNTTKV
jgi:hypothetical protein